MRIMVPLDGSEFSEQAMPAALDIAARTNAEIHIVRSHTATTSEVPQPEGAIWDIARDSDVRAGEIEDLLRAASLWSARTSSAIRSFLLDPPTVHSLAEHVEKHKIDLVVMTTHGRGGMSRAWLGSVADRLVRLVTVPVMLQRPYSVAASGGAGVDATNAGSSGARPRILVPLDGSASAEFIIQHAVELGTIYTSSYTLLRVINATQNPPLQSGADVACLRHEAEDYLALKADALRGEGLEVDTRVIIQSNVAAAIVEEAVESKASTIALGTHGATGWSSVAFGSVADKVLRSATVPLLVVKPPGAFELQGARR